MLPLPPRRYAQLYGEALLLHLIRDLMRASGEAEGCYTLTQIEVMIDLAYAVDQFLAASECSD